MQSPKKPDPRSARVNCSGRKKSGEPCGAWALKGELKCRMHLGKKPGTAGGRPIEHGLRSSLPARLRERADAAHADERLSDLRETASVLSALVQEIAARLEQGDTPEFREHALSLLVQIESNKEGSDAAWNALAAHVRSGVKEDAGRSLLWERVERLSKRLEEWRKIDLSAKNAVSLDELTKLWVRVLSTLERLLPPEQFHACRDNLARELLPSGMPPSASLN